MSIHVILTTLTGRDAGHEYIFAGQTVCTLGRSRCCTIRLTEDPTVSRQHCSLEIDETAVKAYDLGSKNGTFVNGVLIGQRSPDEVVSPPPSERVPCLLQSGDQLALGHHIFVIDIVESIPEFDTLLEADSPRLVLARG